MVDINLKFSNKTFFLVIAVFTLLIASGVVYAFGGSSPSIVGHSSGEIDGLAWEYKSSSTCTGLDVNGECQSQATCLVSGGVCVSNDVQNSNPGDVVVSDGLVLNGERRTTWPVATSGDGDGFWTAFGNTGKFILFGDSGDNYYVGIGVDIPFHALHVAGDIFSNANIITDDKFCFNNGLNNYCISSWFEVSSYLGDNLAKDAQCPPRSVWVEEYSSNNDERLIYESCERYLSEDGARYLVKLKNVTLRDNNNFYYMSSGNGKFICAEYGLDFVRSYQGDLPFGSSLYRAWKKKPGENYMWHLEEFSGYMIDDVVCKSGDMEIMGSVTIQTNGDSVGIGDVINTATVQECNDYCSVTGGTDSCYGSDMFNLYYCFDGANLNCVDSYASKISSSGGFDCTCYTRTVDCVTA